MLILSAKVVIMCFFVSFKMVLTEHLGSTIPNLDVLIVLFMPQNAKCEHYSILNDNKNFTHLYRR